MRIDGKGLIDRTHPVTFRFDGRSYPGFAGDTVASALLANGVRLMGRSFKYHRPRGVLTAGARRAERAGDRGTRRCADAERARDGAGNLPGTGGAVAERLAKPRA